MRVDQIETELSIEVEAKKGPHPVNQQVSRRLKNIEGQVRGIQRMVDQEQYCVDLLTQISAVRAALNSVGMLILRRHIDTCVTNAIKAGGEGRVQIIDELMSMLSKARL